ncbi:hypothetical protein [Methylobacterium aquaticum]|uniref:hypothetical protein n=1 Tax=Methylobacterium aquaticum TaxID=270351 RepID=UPI0019330A22|nr:hypothetical protein [Methylobacterium aquaticum]QRE77567.1 hypothetical protein F1D61_32130 [Methylobacterium aquaticum]
MALDQGHAVEVRAQVRSVFDGVARRLGEVERAGDSLRHLAPAAPSAAVTLSIPVPDGTDLPVLAARLSRHPSAIEAQVGAPS